MLLLLRVLVVFMYSKYNPGVTPADIQSPEAFHKKVVLKNFALFTGKNLCWGLFLIKLQLYQNQTPAQVFSCEYCKIFKNTYFEEHLLTAASDFTTTENSRKPLVLSGVSPN